MKHPTRHKRNQLESEKQMVFDLVNRKKRIEVYYIIIKKEKINEKMEILPIGVSRKSFIQGK